MESEKNITDCMALTSFVVITLFVIKMIVLLPLFLNRNVEKIRKNLALHLEIIFRMKFIAKIISPKIMI